VLRRSVWPHRDLDHACPVILNSVADNLSDRKGGMSTSSHVLKQKAYHEIKQFFLIAFYLWVIFGLLILYKSVVLAEEHIDFAFHGLAIINALAFAKVVHVGRALHLGERLDDAPLIYPTLLKSASFSLLVACAKILEDAVVGHFRGKSFQESVSDFGGGTWRGILVLTVLLFVLLIPFFGLGELQRVLGKGRLAQLFFRPRPISNPGGISSEGASNAGTTSDFGKSRKSPSADGPT
jgi:hypothetical protein